MPSPSRSLLELVVPRSESLLLRVASSELVLDPVSELELLEFVPLEVELELESTPLFVSAPVPVPPGLVLIVPVPVPVVLGLVLIVPVPPVTESDELVLEAGELMSGLDVDGESAWLQAASATQGTRRARKGAFMGKSSGGVEGAACIPCPPPAVPMC